ncbi:ABC transporter ATP-binding protein [Amylibacter marinus]|uniref:ABC transporter ATP-binding protein n=1 Tax=Amylibacter marinus TaxID=1475483 RepID=A0ABQ5VUZ6_9RHOB|nr:ABC transporter ATP-binding protein [Amylibacter marinus]GLQ35077.1 ABC transporter ATP-binding protein [Amylibacter marinus]
MTQQQASANRPILEVKNLVTAFDTRHGTFTAVDDVSLELVPGETLCLVGESGSGKSVLSRSILQLVDRPGRIVSGEILLHEAHPDPKQDTTTELDLAKLEPRSGIIRNIRGRDIGMIFQEPMSSLSPVHTIGSQISESLKLHEGLNKKQARERVIEMLRRVEIPNPERAIDQYPFEFSGGMRQRAMIAMALVCNPKVLIADEPTTALDVTIQAEILDLLEELKTQNNMAILFITHDMGVVAEIADKVAVMRYGKLVENGNVKDVFANPQHDYTKSLLQAAHQTQLPSTERLAMREERPLGDPILEAKSLRKEFYGKTGLLGMKKTTLVAVDDANFTLREGESLGIVGESGSGKTTLARCIQRVLSVNSGELHYTDRSGASTEITQLDDKQLQPTWRDMRTVFQDPFASLNPRMTVSQIIGECLLLNGMHSKADRRARILELLDLVGLPSSAMERFPHAFSGGQRQRISIARAIAPNPRIVIADEATSALDVSIRIQIMDLLLDLQKQLNLSYIFISHDVGLVRFFCDRVLVMYKGQIVESGDSEQVCTKPNHEYTQALLSAVPIADPTQRGQQKRVRYQQ